MVDIKTKIIAVAEDDNGFEFNFYVEKAEISTEDPTDEFSIVGVASTPNIDHDLERMGEPALKRMANIINEKSVPLRIEHQKSDNAIIGNVVKAWLDERNKLWIKAKLNKENPAAVMLHDALKAGAKLGLSVGGRVKRATRELAEGVGKMVKTFYDVILDEVSVTPRPSNYDAWLIAKHYKDRSEPVDSFYGTRLETEFLFENPKFDYLSMFEKSIPSQAWKKVEPENNIITEMKKEEIKVEDEKIETEKEDTPEVVETHEVTEDLATKSYVDKKFSELTKLIKSFAKQTLATTVDATDVTRETTAGTTEQTVAATDQNLATDVKDENPAQERTIKQGANGTQDATPVAETIATESSNPATPYVENPAQPHQMGKAEEVVETKPSETEKADTDEPSVSSEDEQLKEVEPETETTKGDEESSGSSSNNGEEYELPELKRAVKSGRISNIDAFVAYVAKSLSDIKRSLAQKGQRVVGIETAFADIVRNDSSIQKSIRAWMNQPGEKKSVVYGSPYVFMRDGSRLKLIDEGAFVQKSVNPNAKFGDVYKQHFSSDAEKKSSR